VISSSVKLTTQSPNANRDERDAYAQHCPQDELAFATGLNLDRSAKRAAPRQRKQSNANRGDAEFLAHAIISTSIHISGIWQLPPCPVSQSSSARPNVASYASPIKTYDIRRLMPSF
jgi:hypothetical protein